MSASCARIRCGHRGGSYFSAVAGACLLVVGLGASLAVPSLARAALTTPITQTAQPVTTLTQPVVAPVATQVLAPAPLPACEKIVLPAALDACRATWRRIATCAGCTITRELEIVGEAVRAGCPGLTCPDRVAWTAAAGGLMAGSIGSDCDLLKSGVADCVLPLLPALDGWGVGGLPELGEDDEFELPPLPELGDQIYLPRLPDTGDEIDVPPLPHLGGDEIYVPPLPELDTWELGAIPALVLRMVDNLCAGSVRCPTAGDITDVVARVCASGRCTVAGVVRTVESLQETACMLAGGCPTPEDVMASVDRLCPNLGCTDPEPYIRLANTLLIVTCQVAGDCPTPDQIVQMVNDQCPNLGCTDPGPYIRLANTLLIVTCQVAGDCPTPDQIVQMVNDQCPNLGCTDPEPYIRLANTLLIVTCQVAGDCPTPDQIVQMVSNLCPNLNCVVLPDVLQMAENLQRAACVAAGGCPTPEQVLGAVAGLCPNLSCGDPAPVIRLVQTMQQVICAAGGGCPTPDQIVQMVSNLCPNLNCVVLPDVLQMAENLQRATCNAAGGCPTPEQVLGAVAGVCPNLSCGDPAPVIRLVQTMQQVICAAGGGCPTPDQIAGCVNQVVGVVNDVAGGSNVPGSAACPFTIPRVEADEQVNDCYRSADVLVADLLGHDAVPPPPGGGYSDCPFGVPAIHQDEQVAGCVNRAGEVTGDMAGQALPVVAGASECPVGVPNVRTHEELNECMRQVEAAGGLAPFPGGYTDCPTTVPDGPVAGCVNAATGSGIVPGATPCPVVVGVPVGPPSVPPECNVQGIEAKSSNVVDPIILTQQCAEALAAPALAPLCDAQRASGPDICPDDPDRDQDGYPDDRDFCPDHHGSSESGDGCPPDRDTDGFHDGVDACPDAAGVNTSNGCPPPPPPVPNEPEEEGDAPSPDGDDTTVEERSRGGWIDRMIHQKTGLGLTCSTRSHARGLVGWEYAGIPPGPNVELTAEGLPVAPPETALIELLTKNLPHLSVMEFRRLGAEAGLPASDGSTAVFALAVDATAPDEYQMLIGFKPEGGVWAPEASSFCSEVTDPTEMGLPGRRGSQPQATPGSMFEGRFLAPARQLRKYVFLDNVPNNLWRTRIHEGAARWNELGQSPQWAHEEGDVSGTFDEESFFVCTEPSADPLRDPRAKIGLVELSKGALATTRTCHLEAPNDGELYSGLMAFDKPPNSSGNFKWWLDNNNNGKIPFGLRRSANGNFFYFDLLSIATHEFGHLNGWAAGGHWDQDGPDSDSAPDYRKKCRFSESQTTPLSTSDGQSHPYKIPASRDDIYGHARTMCRINNWSTTHARTLGNKEKDAFRAHADDFQP